MFQFKQFSVDQTDCAMKINTDGVLLGALAETNQPKKILDIGTGTGVIALMLAQRFPDAIIDAVEVDNNAAKTAESNFTNSTFVDRLTLFADSFEAFFESHKTKQYDLIISNPPFYINSLQSPGAGKTLRKHADADFFDSLLSGSKAHLTDIGSLWLILPINTAELVKRLAVEQPLFVQQTITIKSYPESAPHREILILGLQQTKMAINEFVIYHAPKRYSAQYRTVLHDFFTIFP